MCVCVCVCVVGGWVGVAVIIVKQSDYSDNFSTARV